LDHPLILIGSVEIPVLDLARATHWYKEVLGYSCTWSDNHHAMLAMQGNNTSTKILLVQTEDPKRLSFKSTNTGITHSVIDFETDNLEAFHAKLSANTPELAPIPEPANDWAPRGFGFVDSEGNQLAVFCYGKSK